MPLTIFLSWTSSIIPLLLALIAFGILITVHECGHFLFCKLFQITTPTFSIGFGPTILQRTIGETNFRLALIPLGGYVEISGLDEPGQGEQKYAKDISKNSFNSKSWWQKAFVILGGICGNIIFAFIILTLLIQQGFLREWCNSTKLVDIQKESVAAMHGLTEGDTILSINQVNVKDKPHKAYQTISHARKNAQEKLILSFSQNGQTKQTIIPLEKSNSAEASAQQQLCFIFEQHKVPLLMAMKNAFQATVFISQEIIQSLGRLVRQRDTSSLSGPIGILQVTTKAAQLGLLSFLFLVAIISINLAIFNLLPLPILDGGQLLLITIETILGKSLSNQTRILISNICWLAFIALFIFASYQDIRRILGW